MGDQQATETSNPYDAQAAIEGAISAKVRVEGTLRAVGGAAAVGTGVVASSTGPGAAVGVPLAAWGGDQVYTGLTELGTGQGQTSLGGQGIQAIAGNGPGGQILTGVYDTAPAVGMVAYSPRPGVNAMEAETQPLGVRGPISGREFDPAAAGGPIRQLTTDRIRITDRGIDVVEQHVARFGPDPANEGMIQRLRDIAAGRLQATDADLNFYSHELREFVRYRQLGQRTGHPLDRDAAYDLWNNAHTATLEDYGLREGPGVLYHPSVLP